MLEAVNGDPMEEEMRPEDSLIEKESLGQTVLLYTFQILYPTILFMVGFLGYVSVFTLAYQLLGIVFALSFNRADPKVASVVVKLSLVVLGLQVLGNAAYFIFCAAAYTPNLWSGFGFFQPNTSLQYAQLIVPPVFVGVFSIVFLVLMGRIRAGQDLSGFSPWHLLLFCVALVISGAWVPNVMGAVFFLGFCILLLAFATKQRMSRIMNHGVVALLFGVLVSLQFLLYQVYQVEGVAQYGSPYAKFFGVSYYGQWIDLRYTTVMQLISFVFALVSASIVRDVVVDVSDGAVRIDAKMPATVRRFIGAHGWMIALIATALIVVLVNSMIMALLLLVVYLGMWMSPRYKAHTVIRLICMIVTVLTSIASYGFNVAGFATDLDQSGFFEFLGLRLLSPFVVYVMAESLCIFMWAIHWRWRVEDVESDSSMDDATFYARWIGSFNIPPPADFTHDTWASGEIICRLLRAMASKYDHLINDDWDEAQRVLLTDFGIEVHVDKGDVDYLDLIAMLYLRSASVWRVFQSFFQAHFYKVALLFCFLAGAVDVSIFNLGFMVILLAFVLVGSKLRRKLWIVAVAYSQAVTLALYMWQFSFTENWNSEWTRIVGLITYDNVWNLMWHIFAMAFLVLQLFLYRYHSARLARVTLQQSQRVSPLFKYIMFTVDFFVQRFAVWVVFLAMFLTVTLEYASITSAMFLLLLTVLIGLRFVSSRTSYYVWPAVLLVSFLVFIARYACAFDQLDSYLRSAESVFPIAQIGILIENSQKLVFWIAGPMAIFVLSVHQWSVFQQLERPALYKLSIHELPSSLTAYARLHYSGSFFVVIQFTKRLLLIHIANMVSLVAFGVAIVQVGAIGAVYVIAACLALRVGFGGLLGSLLVLFTVLILPLEMVFEIPYVRAQVSENWTGWIGLVQGNGPLITAVTVLILLRCEAFVRKQFGADEEIRGKPLFFSQGQQATNERLTLESFAHVCTDFASSIFLNYSIEIINLMVLLNVFLRLTVVSIAQLSILVITLLAPRRASLTMFLSGFYVEIVLILAQYFFLLGLPPAIVASPKPWLESLSPAQAQWLSVSIVPAGLLMSDFVLCLLLSLLARNQREGFLMKRAKERSGSNDYILAETEPLLLQEVSSAEEDMYSSVLGGAAFAASSAKSEEVISWAEIKYAAANVSQYLLLLMVFVAGAVGADLLSLFYICFSLCFLLFVNQLLERPGLWRVVQVYAFLVLFLKLVYQIPYFEINNELVLNLLGLSKLTYKTAFTKDGIVFDVLVVMLITLQFLILESDVYLNQVRLTNKRERATSKTLLRSMRRTLVEQWVKVLRDQVDIAKSIRKAQQAEGVVSLEPKVVGTPQNVRADSRVTDKEENSDDGFDHKMAFKESGGLDVSMDSKNDGKKEAPDENDNDVADEGNEHDEEKPGKFRQLLDRFILWCYMYPWGQLRETIPKQPFRALVSGIVRVISFNTDKLCYFCFVLDATLNANMFGVVYPIVAFLYANVMYPLPKRRFWKACMMFAVGMLIWKFFWRLSLFCVCNGQITVSAEACSCKPVGITWDSLVGITVTHGAFVMDIILLLVLVLHRSSLQQLGLWDHVSSYWRSESNQRTEEEQAAAAKRSVLDKIRYWFQRAFARVEPTSDYYAYGLLAETCTFLMLVFFPQDFSGLSELNNNAVRNILTSDTIPLVYLLILMTQFIFILVDRAIYLRQSAWGKYLFLVLQVLLVHAVFFFLIPLTNQVGFLQSPAVIVVYLLKCCWFFISGRQIRDGFPITLERNLMSSFSSLNYYAYIIYRAIPFLYELKTTLEWALTPTTLEFFHWFILDDIRSELFQCECRWVVLRAKEKPKGEPQKWYLKLLMGGGLVVGLVLLLWFPLFLVSSSNPLLAKNPVTKAELQIALRGWEPLYLSQTSEITTPNKTQFDALLRRYRGIVFNSDANQVQYIRFQNYAETVWSISPEGYKNLRESLQEAIATETEPFLEVSLNFYRSSEVISDFRSTKLSLNETEHFLQVLDYSLNCTGKNPADPYSYCNSFDAANLIPRFQRLPLQPPIVYPSEAPSNLIDVRMGITRSVHTFKYRVDDNGTDTTDEAVVFSEFWGTKDIEPEPLFNTDDIVLVVFSQQVPLLFAGFASAGVIALYVGVVFAVGQLLRSAFSGLHSQVEWYFLEDTKPLFQMCQQIAYARRFHLLQQDADFQDLLKRAAEFDEVDGEDFRDELELLNGLDGFDIEEELYWKVISIARNPKRLIEETRANKEKVD